MQENKRHQEYWNDSTPISEIEPIPEGGLTAQSRGDLAQWVEAPLLEACQRFYDKGIKTELSSANKYDVEEGYAHIAIDFESLSPANREIALTFGEQGHIQGSIPKKGIYIKIPLTSNSTVGGIKKVALDIVDEFEQQ